MGGRSTSRGRVLLACLTGLGGCAVDSTPSPFELSTTEAQLPASTSTTTGETGSTGTTEVLDTMLPTGTTSPGTTAVPVECGNGVVESGEASPVSPYDGDDAFALIETTIGEVFPALQEIPERLRATSRDQRLRQSGSRTAGGDPCRCVESWPAR